MLLSDVLHRCEDAFVFLNVDLDNVKYGLRIQAAKLLDSVVPCFQGTAAEDEGPIEDLTRRSLDNCVSDSAVCSCHEDDSHLANFFDVMMFRTVPLGCVL